jgi:8-oxo-dGTP pyrophosphatase MutT (NUDIX family)/GNAT superfamily N-acetyltransferase
MVDINQDNMNRALAAIKAGDWKTAVEYGKKVPRNFDVWQQMPSAAHSEEKGDSSLSDEAIHGLLDAQKSYGMADDRGNFLFELADHLPKNAGGAVLNRIADEGKEDGLVTETVQRHPNFKLSPEKQGIKDVSDFWASYETGVQPHHFATVKSLFTGQPETLVDHRGETGSSDAHMHLVPHMPAYAKEVQGAVLKQARDNGHQIKYFANKPYVKVFRGVGGEYADQIMKAVNYDPKTGEMDSRTVKVPVSHLTSWSTEPELAHRFATSRAKDDWHEDEHPINKGVVFEKWLPVEDILHSGQHTVVSGQEHPHSNEKELVFGHTEPHVKVPSSAIHFLKQPGEDEGFVYPWSSQPGIPRPKQEGTPKTPKKPKLNKAEFGDLADLAKSGEFQQAGFRHRDTQKIYPTGPFHDILQLPGAEDSDLDQYDAGFIGNDGKFYTREEAAHLLKVKAGRGGLESKGYFQGADDPTMQGRAEREGLSQSVAVMGKSELSNSDTAVIHPHGHLSADEVIEIERDSNSRGKQVGHSMEAHYTNIRDKGDHVLVMLPLGRVYSDSDAGDLSDASKERVRGYAALNSKAPPIRVLHGAFSASKGSQRAYVVNGNHRVAAARARGDTHIEAMMPVEDWNRFEPKVNAVNVLLAKSLADIPQGKQLTYHEGSGVASYDYSHLLSPKAKGMYNVTLRVLPRVKGLNVHVQDKEGNTVGEWAGNWEVDPKGQISVTPHDVRVDEDHRRRGLGQSLYEAAFSYAKNTLGASTVSLGPHSTSASAVHQKLARKHGMDYKPTPLYGKAALIPNKEAWTDPDLRGDYDARFAPTDYTLKSELDPNAHKCVSIWCEKGGQVLWGQRRKDGKWALPGGHIDRGELPEHAAIRELYEESGITPRVLQEVGVANGGEHGDIPIYVYRAVASGEPTSVNDPDREFKHLEWVSCGQGVPAKIANNLAHPRNVVMRFLGFQGQEELAKREEHWNTPEFKHWFGGSQIKDEQGNPKVLYHGTAKDFSSFDTSSKNAVQSGIFGPVGVQRSGSFFTPSPDKASDYAGGEFTNPEGGQRIVPVYLNIKKPFDIRSGLTDAHIDELDRQGINPRWVRGLGAHWELFDDDSGVQDALERAGYDGAIFNEDYGSGEHRKRHETYVAFHPHQIKSAIGNQGTYSPVNTDITKAEQAPDIDPYPIPDYAEHGPKDIHQHWHQTGAEDHTEFAHPKNRMMVNQIGRALVKMVNSSRPEGHLDVLVDPKLPEPTTRAYHSEGVSYISPKDAQGVAKIFNPNTPLDVKLEKGNHMKTLLHEMLHGASNEHSGYDTGGQIALEEASTEILANHMVPHVMEHSAGAQVPSSPPMFRADSGEVELNYPTAYSIAVRKFGLLSAYAEGLHDHQAEGRASHVAHAHKVSRAITHYAFQTKARSDRGNWWAEKLLDKKLGLKNDNSRQFYAARDLLSKRLFGDEIHDKTALGLFHNKKDMEKRDLDEAVDAAKKEYERAKR